MQWPKDILDTFDKALDLEPAEGLDKLTVLKALLDEATRRAIARTGGDPTKVGPALRTPYTPLGSVVNGCVNGMARRLGLAGAIWKEAVDAFYDYVERNAEAVFAAFEGQ